MVLLPKTPPLTYPNMKRFKDQKKHHFFTSLFTFIKRKCSTCKTSAGVLKNFRNKKISREISCKKFKTHLQFYVKISNKNFSSFFAGKSLNNFSKKSLLRPFFKNSLQLVPNLTPIRKLLCTFSPQCCYYPRPPLFFP